MQRKASSEAAYSVATRRLRAIGTASAMALVVLVALTGCEQITGSGGGSGNDGSDGPGGLEPPKEPAGLSATAESTSVVGLNWNDESEAESGFEIERKKAGANSFSTVTTTGADVTSFADDGLSADTSYTYRVRAVNEAGESPWSSTASALTALAPTVTVVRAESGDPLQDALVFLNASDGMLLTQAQTGSDGTVSFSADEIEGTEVSVSAAKELSLSSQESDVNTLTTVKAVSRNALVLPLGPPTGPSGPGSEPDEIATVRIEVTGVDDSAEQIFVRFAGLEIQGEGPSYEAGNGGSVTLNEVSVLEDALDEEGELTIIVYAANSDGIPIDYGVLTDQAVADGATYELSLDTSPTTVEVEPNRQVDTMSFVAMREGGAYPLVGMERPAGPSEPASFGLFDEFPLSENGEGLLRLRAERVLASPEDSDASGFTFNRRYGDTFPGNLTPQIPTLELGSVGYESATRTVTWSPSGTAELDAKTVSLVKAGESSLDAFWALHAPPLISGESSGEITLPETPEEISGWLGSPDRLHVSAVDLPQYSGYDAVLSHGLSELGGFTWATESARFFVWAQTDFGDKTQPQ